MDENSLKTSRREFIDAFDVLASSGIGVVLVHAKEPHRVCDALQEWAFGKNRPYRIWNCRDGWAQLRSTDDPEDRPEYDGVVDANKALRQINDVDGGGATAWTEGVFVMQYPHWWLSKMPQMIQCLKSYVRDFSETAQRLVLLVPEGYSLPKELENDIPILNMSLPHRDELRSIYQAVIEGATRKGKQFTPPYKDGEVEVILNLGAGMTEMEFESAVAKAIVSNKHTFPKTPLQQFGRVISDTKTEVVKRSEVLELIKPGSIDDIGGLDLLKGWLDELKVTLDPEAFAMGVDRAKGFVAIGPPGTGKSLVSKATASILQLPLVRFDVSRVFAGIVGQSEEKVRSALALCKAMAPCVVWVDEIDKAGIDPRQAGGDSGVSKRIMGAILTFQQENDCGIVWIMTANRSQGLPPELLRPGRMDAVFAVMSPNAWERMEVLRIHLRKRKENPDEVPNLELAVQASKGFVSAEIEGAIKEAKKKSYSQKIPMTGELIASEFGTMKPLAVAFKEDFDEMSQWAQQSARPSSTQHDDDEGVTPRRRSRSTGTGTGSRELDL